MSDMQGELDIPQRNRWLQTTATLLMSKWISKFEAGWQQHEWKDLGRLSMEQLLDQMEQEALDQLSYVMEMKRKLGLQ